MTPRQTAPIMDSMTIPIIDPAPADRRSAASIIEREAESSLSRRERTPLLALVGAAITAVIALAAAGALLA
jgi:hypothetical protein